MIAVIDYGMGNLRSVCNAFESLGADVCMTSNEKEIREAERIVLPGVGAFGECMRNLQKTELIGTIEEEVCQKGKPFFGICVGMQILAREGQERGVSAGLDWIPGVVKRFDFPEQNLRVPHVGWNNVTLHRDLPLFEGLPENPDFYFVHSYYFVPDKAEETVASCDYGVEFAAALLHENLFATQFHPEKSQQHGLRLLENFLHWNP